MKNLQVFVDRRSGDDRRQELDPCRNMPVDIYHRKRRKSTDRRAPNRSLVEDYLAFFDQLPPSKPH